MGISKKMFIWSNPFGLKTTSYLFWYASCTRLCIALNKLPELSLRNYIKYFYILGSFSKIRPVFVHQTTTQCTIYLLVYEDDISITGNNQQTINTLIQNLHKEFTLKDLGYLNCFLGRQVSNLNYGEFIYLRKNTLQIS